MKKLLFLIIPILLMALVPRIADAYSDLIVNGGFESGSANWTLNGNMYADSRFSRARTGTGYAYLSQANGDPGNNLVGWMSQTVFIPTSAISPVLSFWYNITSEEVGTAGNDVLNVTIQNSSGGYLETVAVFSNLHKEPGAGNPYYRQKTFDMSDYKGQTIKINFLTTTNGSYPTAFRIDDVSVSDFSLSHLATVCDTTDPAGPAISMDWNDISGATRYDVYRNGSFYVNTSLDSFFYNNANLVAGNTYTYYIKAITSGGSINSNTVSVFVPLRICESQEFCGDGVCNNGETCESCSNDCGSCEVNICGDGIIGENEECDNGTDNGIACDPGNGGTCSYCSETCHREEVVGPYCGDGIKNQDETDIDCGGNNCDRCEDDKICMTDNDCQSNLCFGNICVSDFPEEDTEDPKLIDFDFSPKNINTEHSSQQVTVNMQVTDNYSGIDYASVSYISPSGFQLIGEPLNLISGNNTDGIYEGIIEFPRYSENGVWKINKLQVYDRQDNYFYLEKQDLIDLGFPTEIVNNSNVYDILAPELLELSFDPDEINTSNEEQIVKVNLRISDNLSGFGSAHLHFRGPSGQDEYSPSIHSRRVYINNDNLINGDSLNGFYSVDLELPQYIEKGWWSLTRIDMEDNLRNELELNQEELEDMDFTTQFYNSASEHDIEAPELLDLYFSEMYINPNNNLLTATLDLKISDNLSGFKEGRLRIGDFTGENNIHLDISRDDLVSGDKINGRYRKTFDIPLGPEEVEWGLEYLSLDDFLYNGDGYGRNDLIDLGFPVYVFIGCGNGFVETGEECDDGNEVSSDGCNARCEAVDGEYDGILISVDDDFIDDPLNHKWNTIQKGIDDAVDGDTVIVGDGTYVENVNIIKSNISLMSENGRDNTIVKYSDEDNSDNIITDSVIQVEGDFVNISGFTINGLTKEGGFWGDGIHISNANFCNIFDNYIYNNYSGVSLSNSTNNTFKNNAISYNVGDGVTYYRGGSDNSFINNTINWNDGVGIAFSPFVYNTNNNIDSNNISNNSMGGIIIRNLLNGSINIITNNIIDANGGTGGILLDRANNNLITNNNFSKNNYGLAITSSNDNHIYFNNFSNNIYGNIDINDSVNYWQSSSSEDYIYKGENYTGYLGNYWNDYIDVDINQNGVWDNPYAIDGLNLDSYPLVDFFDSGVIGDFSEAVCGNGIIEAGEECDDGLEESLTCTSECMLIEGNLPPHPPESLRQGNIYRGVGVGELLNPGEIESILKVEANITDPDGDDVHLEVEVRRVGECGGNFDCEPSAPFNFYLSDRAYEDGSAYVYIPVTNGEYYWRARAQDEYGVFSDWVEFPEKNPNDTGEPDFSAREDFTIAHMTDIHVGGTRSTNPRTLSYSRLTDAFVELESSKPEILLVSGDIVEWANELNMLDYVSLASQLSSRAGVRIFNVPGNHDRYMGRVPNVSNENLELFHENVPMQISSSELLKTMSLINGTANSISDNHNGMGEGVNKYNYYFEYKGIQFVGLDTGRQTQDDGSWGDGIRVVGGRGFENLHIDSLRNQDILRPYLSKILFMHNPMCDFDEVDCSFLADSTVSWSIVNNREEFIQYATSSENNVQIVLAGHTHGASVHDKNGNLVNETSMNHPLFVQTQSATEDSNRTGDQIRHGYRLIDIHSGGIATPHTEYYTNFYPKVIANISRSSNENIQICSYDPLHKNERACYRDNAFNIESLHTPTYVMTARFPASAPEGNQNTQIISYNTSEDEMADRIQYESHYKILKSGNGVDDEGYDMLVELHNTDNHIVGMNQEIAYGIKTSRLDMADTANPSYIAAAYDESSGIGRMRFNNIKISATEEHDITIDWAKFINTDNMIACVAHKDCFDLKRNITESVELELLDDSVVIDLGSPGELRVVDEHGNITGLVDGVILENIPYSMYIAEEEKVVIFSSAGDSSPQLTFSIVGIDTDTYDLDVTLKKDGNEKTFNANDIKTNDMEVHGYTINWDILDQGGQGVIIEIDKDGDGIVDKTSEAGNQLFDVLAPSTDIAVIADNIADGLYSGKVNFALEATDNPGGIGVQKTEYSFDNGTTWHEYAEPVTISEYGGYTMLYRSIDWFGNQEEDKSVSFRIVSACDLLLDVLDDLEPSGPNDPVSRITKQVVLALDENFWVDKNYLEKSGGQSVYSHLENAARGLKGIEGADEVKKKIGLAVEILTKLEMEEVEGVESDKKKQKALDNASSKMDSYYEQALEYGSEALDKVVNLFGKVWQTIGQIKSLAK